MAPPFPQPLRLIPLPISSVEAFGFDPSWIRRNGQAKYISVNCVVVYCPTLLSRLSVNVWKTYNMANVGFDIDKLKLLSTSGRLFAHSTLRNLDDISGINGSSQLHRPYELKFLNATLLSTRPRATSNDVREALSPLTIAAVDFLPPHGKKRMRCLEFDDISAFALRLILVSLM
ncbi:hypothetical protein G5I_12620 [Acromyrmex echinatior]|uniref:Uncharacterized protein n=1 Tax=Acromyrmex echinatior TaxID=103372 RepID=F4X2T9_ACREC|nr:hypothetical protein G5I_12620 [Acromyrmex echinatior]